MVGDNLVINTLVPPTPGIIYVFLEFEQIKKLEEEMTEWRWCF